MPRALLVAFAFGAVSAARAGVWTDDFAKAKEQAKTEGKAMLLNFTGSDWCGWCKKLDAEVFSKKEFKKYADERLVCVKIDFPMSFSLSSKTVRQNEELKGTYGIRGYPTIILLDPDAKQIGKTGYQDGGAENYVEHLKGIIEPHSAKWKPEAPAAGAAAAVIEQPVRTWTSAKGSTLEARFEKMVGAQVVLRKEDGSTVKIAVDGLSDADRQHLKAIRAY